MTKSVLYIGYILISLLIISCGSEHHHETGAPEHETDHHDISLELNGDQKWMANPETTAGIEQMGSLMEEYRSEPDKFPNLMGELFVVFNSILEQCTMTGEAHDQLHNYLVPLRDQLSGLEADDEAQRLENFKRIEKYLEVYNTYFE